MAKDETKVAVTAPPMQIEYWDIEKLIPYARNPRKNDDAVPKMAGLIREFGFKVPVIIRSTGDVIDGHLRLKAAWSLGMTQIPVVIADEWTDAQVRAFRLAVNRSAEWAEWDDELLKLELDDLKLEDFDLDLIGFEDVALDDGGAEGLTDPDEVPEMQEKPVTRQGDIWLLGKHRLMCGDSTDAGSVALLMAGEKADMVFTDPPYNVSYSDKNAALNAIGRGNRIQTPINGDNASSDEEAGEKLWKPAFANMRQNAASHCSIYCTMPQGGAHMMMMMMASASWQVKHELIWVKNNIVLGRCDYNYRHEPILFGWAETHKFYGKGEFTQSVWEIPKPQKSDLHPTMKPIALIENALLNSSKEQDIILDLFGGSGSTLIACEQTGRQCRMMELSEHYVDVIVRRWQDFTGDKAILEGDGRTFAEFAEIRTKS